MDQITSNSENNKRIAKNTLLLYIRMFVVIAVGLYTSRVVLKVLGVSDYGLYNIVGGIITMAGFLNAAMTAASQRFLSFELGRGDKKRLSHVFCTSINIHATISIIAFIIAETLGLWFVNEKLNIPDGRMYAANWVYQASVITFIINVMSVPYSSSVVAHEKMNVFAYISILDVFLKLIIVYLLLLFDFDKLIVYSVLMVFVVLFVLLCYIVYCRRYFDECHYRFVNSSKLFSEMFSFAGWSIVGSLGFSFKDQLSNIILNLFFGTTVNAARGVGMYVTAAVTYFANSFTMALNPQITKQYAAGNLETSRDLVYKGSRYSFYLLTLVSIPVILNIDYILSLWLEIVPQYTRWFVIFSILASLLYTLSECVTKAIQATGRIKWFQIGVSIIMLSELPLAWILVKLGYPPHAVMWPTLLTYFVALIFRFWLLHNYVDGYCFREYFLQVVIRCILVFIISFFLCRWLCDGIHDSFLGHIYSVLISFLITGVIILFGGITSNERSATLSYIKSKMK